MPRTSSDASNNFVVDPAKRGEAGQLLAFVLLTLGGHQQRQVKAHFHRPKNVCRPNDKKRGYDNLTEKFSPTYALCQILKPTRSP